MENKDLAPNGEPKKYLVVSKAHIEACEKQGLKNCGWDERYVTIVEQPMLDEPKKKQVNGGRY